MTIKILTVVMAAVLSSLLLLVTIAGPLLGASGAGPCNTAPATLPPLPSAIVGLVTAAAPTTNSPSTGPNRSSTLTDVIGCANGGSVLARAASWLTAWAGGPVPYLSSTNPSTWFGGYRRDCSGYASMALGLPGPGLDTRALAAASTPIPRTALQAGDLLINRGAGPAGHVVVFDRWADPGQDSYLGYEQSGDGGTHHRVIPYPYSGGYPMSPYRYPAAKPPAPNFDHATAP